MDDSQPLARRLPPGIGLVAAIFAVAGLGLHGQQPTFRSSVDVVVVDVQVVDRNGRPLPRLGAERFEVQIDGQKRRVISADFIEHADPGAPKPPAADAADTGRAGAASGRTYVLGIDVASFSVVESRAVVEGARDFIRRLQPADAVGLYVFPVGPKFRPSTDHTAILHQLETVVGSREALHNSHGLSVLDVIDIAAETARGDSTPLSDPLPTGRGQQAQGSSSETLDRIVARECGPLDRPCGQAVLADAQGMSFILQGQATESLNGLRQLVRALDTISGRKTLVLLSGGIAVSDRPGGRPDIGDLPRLLGKEAAMADTTIYALFVETNFLQLVSAKSHRPNQSFDSGRDQMVFGRVMDEFTGASGGAILPVAQGSGGDQFDRVLRETSSQYLLAVQPAPADRDGSLRRLTVRVKGLPRGASVRSRMWVVVPRPS